MRRLSSGALATPYLVGLGFLVGLPLIGGALLSLFEYSGIGPARFAGTGNYAEVIGDSRFWGSLGNSLVFAAISVPVRLTIAVALALLLARKSRGVATTRAIVYLPSVIPDAAYALLWLWLLNPVYGPIAALLQSAGVTSTGLLTDPWVTRIAIALMGAFQIGEAFVIALAARRIIPERLYEAAAVDGARPWYVVARVTLPLMAPLIGLLAVRDFILSFQTNFVPAVLITEGGPRYATTYLPLYIYRSAFSYLRLGYASAMSGVLLVLTAAALYVQYRLVKRWRPLT